ncbi:MAG: glycyl-radical enzyme activating protein [Clostridia bacterium]|nr:glycyl-radical enzyme activating protein [Clostridia bacterium]
MNGIISDIISMSVNDGPGIRTSVYLKGCPLRCAWCHNPEMQVPSPQAMVLSSRCTHCGACFACPSGARGEKGEYDSSRCTGCGLCVSVCPAEACRVVGASMSAGEVLRRVLPDKPFFRLRGGVTISGGEPLLQADFVLELASLLRKNGIGVILETCGYAPWQAMEPLLPLIGCFLYDWKITDPSAHQRWTGVDNRLIYENLKALCGRGADVVLRCPVIPGVNDTLSHFQGIAELAGALPGIRQVDLLPYHALGNDKRMQLGLKRDGFDPPSGETVLKWYRQLSSICPVPVML